LQTRLNGEAKATEEHPMLIARQSVQIKSSFKKGALVCPR